MRWWEVWFTALPETQWCQFLHHPIYPQSNPDIWLSRNVRDLVGLYLIHAFQLKQEIFHCPLQVSLNVNELILATTQVILKVKLYQKVWLDLVLKYAQQWELKKMWHVNVNVKNNPLNATPLKSTLQLHANVYVKIIWIKLDVYNRQVYNQSMKDPMTQWIFQGKNWNEENCRCACPEYTRTACSSGYIKFCTKTCWQFNNWNPLKSECTASMTTLVTFTVLIPLRWMMEMSWFSSLNSTLMSNLTLSNLKSLSKACKKQSCWHPSNTHSLTLKVDFSMTLWAPMTQVKLEMRHLLMLTSLLPKGQINLSATISSSWFSLPYFKRLSEGVHFDCWNAGAPVHNVPIVK